MSQKKRSKKQQARPNQPQKSASPSNRGIIWLTLIIAAVVVVIVLGIQNQNKPYAIDYEGLPVQGSADAPVKVLEFGNYKCPTCQFFAQEMKPQLDKDFIETGKISFYFVNFSSFLGQDAYTAALAAQSVYHQDQAAFWDYYKIIYDNQKGETETWATPDYLVQLARDAKLPIDYELLRKDIDEQTYKSEVDAQNAMTTPMNVTGTPTVFIDGKKYDGRFDYGSLKNAIEEAVNKEQ